MVEFGTMEESVNRDRLSELPDSLIHVIFSFLSIREVVSTSLLSKRWNNLWTTVPCLTFREIIRDGTIERVRNFVNRALFMWNGTNILKFRICIYRVFDSSLADDIDLWMRFAIKYKVQELKICLSYDLDYADLMMENTYRIPQCLYSCSSLRKLSLSGFNLQICGPPPWNLNQLKSLKIRCYHLGELSSNRIMLGSPRLEVFELCLMEDCDNLSIMSTSCQSRGDYIFLWIYQHWIECLEFAVQILKYSNFMDVCTMFGEALRQVFSTSVEKVELSSMCARWCLQMVRASPKKYLLSPSVKFLTLEAGNIHEFGDMMDVLGIFPNLKMLVRRH